MVYNHYPVNESDPLGPQKGPYNALTDVMGFTGFIPSQCFKNVSFMIEKVEAPVIAVVGDPENPITSKMTSFLT